MTQFYLFTQYRLEWVLDTKPIIYNRYTEGNILSTTVAFPFYSLHLWFAIFHNMKEVQQNMLEWGMGS